MSTRYNFTYNLLLDQVHSLLKHATEYYKELFGPQPSYDIRIDPTIWKPVRV